MCRSMDAIAHAGVRCSDKGRQVQDALNSLHAACRLTSQRRYGACQRRDPECVDVKATGHESVCRGQRGRWQSTTLTFPHDVPNPPRDRKVPKGSIFRFGVPGMMVGWFPVAVALC